MVMACASALHVGCILLQTACLTLDTTNASQSCSAADLCPTQLTVKSAGKAACALFLSLHCSLTMTGGAIPSYSGCQHMTPYGSSKLSAIYRLLQQDSSSRTCQCWLVEADNRFEGVELLLCAGHTTADLALGCPFAGPLLQVPSNLLHFLRGIH